MRAAWQVNFALKFGLTKVKPRLRSALSYEVQFSLKEESIAFRFLFLLKPFQAVLEFVTQSCR